MKKYIKIIWKFFGKILLKLYVRDFSVYVYNNPNFTYLVKRGAHSQFGQDLFVLDYFKNHSAKGFFVDVGGNDPIKGSNTYLLEKNGWNGLAIEPQEKLRNLWPAARKTECLNYVIGPENKTVTFVEGNDDQHGLSGVEGFNKCDTDSKKVEVEQRRLTDILKEKNISTVDYLSIDVEGYEMNVLQSIDFPTSTIKMISLENDIGFTKVSTLNIPLISFVAKKLGSELGSNKLRKFLEDKGYKYVARIVCDDFFVKN